jgi:hypothetical protein
MTFILPIGFLRYFWWRFTIWGEIVGIAVGIPFCIFVWFGLGGNQWPFWQVFLTLFGCGAVVITLTALCTKPTDDAILLAFYQKCQPPGFWGPIRRLSARDLGSAVPARMAKGAFFEFAVTLAALACMFLAINTFLGHHIGLALAAAAGFLLLAGIVVVMSVHSLADEQSGESKDG